MRIIPPQQLLLQPLPHTLCPPALHLILQPQHPLHGHYASAFPIGLQSPRIDLNAVILILDFSIDVKARGKQQRIEEH